MLINSNNQFYNLIFILKLLKIKIKNKKNLSFKICCTVDLLTKRETPEKQCQASASTVGS